MRPGRWQLYASGLLLLAWALFLLYMVIYG